MDKIKVAIIGAGFIAHYHARGLKTIPNVQIVAVVATKKESAQKFAFEYDIGQTFTDISTIVGHDAIDAVIICTPNRFHAPYAIEFLKNGKHVFLEKPMAINATEGRQIEIIAKQYD